MEDIFNKNNSNEENDKTNKTTSKKKTSYKIDLNSQDDNNETKINSI